MADKRIDTTRSRAMEDALAEIGTSFLSLGVLTALLCATFRNVLGMEVAAGADPIGQAQHPAKLCYRFAWQCTLLRHQHARHVVNGTGLQDAVQKICIAPLASFGLFHKIGVRVDTVRVKLLTTLA